MSIPPLSSSGGVHPTPQFQTEKIQGIINHYYKSVPSNIQAGCNLVIMQSGIEPVLPACRKCTAQRPSTLGLCLETIYHSVHY